MFTKPVMVPAMSSHRNQHLLTPTRQFPWQLYQSQTPPWWVQLRQWIPQGFLWRTTRLCLFYRRMVEQQIKRYKNALYLSVNVFSSKVLGTLVFCPLLLFYVYIQVTRRSNCLHFSVTLLSYWYLISQFWQHSNSRGFIFAISMGKYEKRALNFAIQVFSTWFYFSNVWTF